MKASEIRELLKILEKPGIISFAGGIPDPKLFPVRPLRRRTLMPLQRLSPPALRSNTPQARDMDHSQSGSRAA
jgi:DNA-binding transcriptional MocR family regulator